MTAKTSSALLLLLCLSGAATFAQAQTVLLRDGFDADNGGVGAAEYSRFASFTATNVDLLAPGYFYNLCQLAGGGTPCVDMEGSGNGSLVTRVEYLLPAGNVGLQFDLAGDQRGGSGNSVTVSLVNTFGQALYSEVFSLPSSARFTTFSRVIPLATAQTARLGFLSGGPADSYGMLLDNVVLTANVAAVPEPATCGLMLAGLAALGAVARRKAS